MGYLQPPQDDSLRERQRDQFLTDDLTYTTRVLPSGRQRASGTAHAIRGTMPGIAGSAPTTTRRSALPQRAILRALEAKRISDGAMPGRPERTSQCMSRGRGRDSHAPRPTLLTLRTPAAISAPNRSRWSGG